MLLDPIAANSPIVGQFAPLPPLSHSQWAERYFYLSAESAAEPGRWRSYPYQVGIMDAFDEFDVETITLMKSARVGYTKLINIDTGYHIHYDPCPQITVQPTIDDANGYSKDEIAPMLRDCQALDGLVSEAKSRDSKNTITKKGYPGGSLLIIGANSARGFRRVTARIIRFDEVDAYPPTAGHEGDQIQLGTKRTETYWNRKIALGSTPTIKNASRIEASFNRSDKRYYFMPCPVCKHRQYFRWKNISWPKDNPHRAYYVCENCKKEIDHKQKFDMIERGKWTATAESDRHAGFHIWAAYSYSPNATWGLIATRFADAEHYRQQTGDDSKLRTVINTDLGETYEEKGERVAIDLISGRGEEFEKTVLPEGVLVITAAADVQKDRIECEIVGWGLGYESWSLDYRVMHAAIDTSDPDDICWKELDDILEREFITSTGIKLRVVTMAVDSGYATDAVKTFVKPRQIRRVYAVKGSSQPWSPLVSRPSQKSIKKGFFIYPVGTDTAKSLFYSRLKKTRGNPGFCHFPEKYGDDYFKMLTSEELKTKYVKGVEMRYYALKRGIKRNEALDTRIYNMAALEILNPNLQSMARTLTRAEPVQQNAKTDSRHKARRRILSKGINAQ
ncbi:MAG: phage terminase large subunit family protein [Gammaproteobacteria bacterium]